MITTLLLINFVFSTIFLLLILMHTVKETELKVNDMDDVMLVFGISLVPCLNIFIAALMAFKICPNYFSIGKERVDNYIKNLIRESLNNE